MSSNEVKTCARCPSPREGKSFCGPCRKAYAHEHYMANKEKYAQRSKKHRAENREACNATASRYYRTPHGKAKRQQYLLKHEYDLTVEQYQTMVSEQGGCCAICLRPERRLHVDHEHSTGRVRGLLCKKCNMGIGLLGDSPAVLTAAAVYLEKK